VIIWRLPSSDKSRVACALSVLGTCARRGCAVTCLKCDKSSLDSSRCDSSRTYTYVFTYCLRHTRTHTFASSLAFSFSFFLLPLACLWHVSGMSLSVFVFVSRERPYSQVPVERIVEKLYTRKVIIERIIEQVCHVQWAYIYVHVIYVYIYACVCVYMYMCTDHPWAYHWTGMSRLLSFNIHICTCVHVYIYIKI